ncbi:MAG: formylglycine-generating enzyme family protein, partial [Limisphaerales bacterium]
EPGTFVMGSPADEPDRVSDEVQHTVMLTQGFLLSDHEVTQAEYRAVMGNSPSRFKGDTLPVDSVSWNDAVLYCQKLTERERAAGRITAQQAYRLPTEAEWEYAARAGTTGIRYGELDAIAWWGGNSGGQTHPVKTKQANVWGLHDMLGNVWEWCGDWYGAYPTGSVTDPTGPSSGSGRVCRGGGRDNGAGSARSAKRFRGDPGDRFSYLGFRPALSSMPLGLEAEWVPKLTARGPVGSVARVEWSLSMEGPWTVWTNVTVGVGGNVLVDLTPGAVSRFYRAVGDAKPVGPAGFVWIPPGTFVMGSPVGELDRDPDEVQHTVTLTQGFWLSDHETTQAEYQAVMGDNISWFRGDTLPVEQVSWDDAVLYCQKLTERERAAGRITAQQAYRLPTEAEWEYAARAGTTGIRYGELDAIAWYIGNSGSQTRPVKQKQPNAWGLYDMMGNVWEWCGDWYGEYPIGSMTDPVGPALGSYRVCRGGSWFYSARGVRSAKRVRNEPAFRMNFLGFRPALSSVR